jgi:predicted TIM-barrel fold metal-dependent hydrolase
LTGDIFQRRFPKKLKSKAPVIKKSSEEPPYAFNWYVEGQPVLPDAVFLAFSEFESLPGASEIEARIADLDAEGTDKEIAFGNAVGAFYSWPDLEVREWVLRIHNEHVAEMQKRAPGRFYGVGQCNFWDMERTRESIEEIKALGLKTLMLPITPKGADGAVMNYCMPEMAPLWEALEESGLPICFHVGEFYQDGPGGLGTTAMVNFGPFRKTLGELIFGGIFDRHPSLQVVFTEAEINWVPGALQTASMAYECFGRLDPKIKRHPREYWQENCFATFTHDPVGLRMLDIVGADRIMWGSDYPHQESTYGFSWSVMKEVVDYTSPEDAAAILGGTAMKVFNL